MLDFFCPCQPPVLYQPRDLINVPAIVEPHQGTSYNPPVDAHQELLLKAAAVEEKRLKGVEKMTALKAKMDSALRETDGLNNLGAAGMTVTAQIDSENAREEEGDEGDDQGSSLPRNSANRKTKAQKNKAARILAEVRLFFPIFF
jgi:nucleolar protein 53